MRRSWKALLKNGEVAMVRVAGKDLTFKECLDILDFRGYTVNDIQSLDEIWEAVYEY